MHTFNRYTNVEKIDSVTQDVINSYRAIEEFLDNDEYGEDLKEDVEFSFLNFLPLLKKWKKDLEKNEHGIVIAG